MNTGSLFEKLTSFFSPSKILNTTAALNKSTSENTTSTQLSPLVKQLSFNNVQKGGKRKSLKRRNKKNNKTKRR